MPRNEASETRKRHVVALLEQCLGPLCLNHPHRTDWHISEDGAVEVFITDSKAHFRQRPWFDMKAADLKELARHPAGFVLFILGDDTHFLVIPARDIVAQIPNHREGLTKKGFYHFNTVLGSRAFKQLPAWDYSKYFGKIDLIPQVHHGTAASRFVDWRGVVVFPDRADRPHSRAAGEEIKPSNGVSTPVLGSFNQPLVVV